MIRIPNLVLDDAEAAAPRGHYALHRRDGANHELVRDPLGVNKLFFAIADGDVESANYLAELRAAGHPPERIWSVPSGHRIRVSPEEERLEIEKVAGPRFAEEDDGLPLEAHAARIREALAETFEALDRALGEGPRFVTLSGGLDSSGIAALAREHFHDGVTALSFTVEGEDGPGGDLDAARRVADALGLPLIEVSVRADRLAERVDDVLLYGQDWRDFNVHCGLVNLALAEVLPAGATVLTGDGMNELMADYAPVEIQGRVLYELPRLSPSKLRRHLARGLDTGDREVGIFARYGIRTVQPYLLAADAYAALPPHFVGHEQAKQRLARAVLDERVPDFVYRRPKVRAQCGSSERVGGTVRALLDAGWDQDGLAARFRELFGFTERDQRRLIRAGFYRFPTEWPES